MKRHRVCEIPAHFVRHTQTQAVCVWGKRWARISAGLRWLLDSCRWRRRRNYHSVMSPIATTIRRRTTVKYRQPSTSTVLRTVSYSLSSFPYHMMFFMTVCYFSQKYRSYSSNNNNIIHTVHALSATYGKERLTGGAFDRGAFYPGAIDRGGKKMGPSDRGGGNWPGGGDWPYTVFYRVPRIWSFATRHRYRNFGFSYIPTWCG